MKPSVKNLVVALSLMIVGLAAGAIGIHIGEKNDVPGGAMVGMLVMITLVVLGLRTARRKN